MLDPLFLLVRKTSKLDFKSISALRFSTKSTDRFHFSARLFFTARAQVASAPFHSKYQSFFNPKLALLASFIPSTTKQQAVNNLLRAVLGLRLCKAIAQCILWAGQPVHIFLNVNGEAMVFNTDMHSKATQHALSVKSRHWPVCYGRNGNLATLQCSFQEFFFLRKRRHAGKAEQCVHQRLYVPNTLASGAVSPQVASSYHYFSTHTVLRRSTS